MVTVLLLLKLPSAAEHISKAVKMTFSGKSGIKQKHRKAASRRERLKSKLARRKKCLEAKVKPPLSSGQLEKANDMIKCGLAYISSDESEDEGDGKNTRLVRRLRFESSEMADIKRIIDEHYCKIASKKQLNNMLVLIKNDRSPVSGREIPKNALQWALQPNMQGTVNCDLLITTKGRSATTIG